MIFYIGIRHHVVRVVYKTKDVLATERIKEDGWEVEDDFLGSYFAKIFSRLDTGVGLNGIIRNKEVAPLHY